MKTLYLPLIAAVLALAACSDSPTWDENDPAGRMEFRFSTRSGAIQGTFAAEGVRLAGSEQDAEYAAAFTDGPAIRAVGYQQHNGAERSAQLIIPSRSKGTYAFTAYCIDETKCPGISFGAPVSVEGTSYLLLCYVGAGSVTVTRVSERRIAGRFSGTGDCRSYNGEFGTTVTVSGGSFDTPIIYER